MRALEGWKKSREEEGRKEKNGEGVEGGMKKGRVNEEKESWRKEEEDEGRRVKCGEG